MSRAQPRILLVSLALTACQATFREPRVAAGPVRESWQSYYLFGAFGAAELDVRDLCASGQAHEIRTRANALTLLLSLSMVYTPRIVSVTCAP